MFEPVPDLARMTTIASSAVTQRENAVARVSRRHVGNVVIRSGRLVACDPFGDFPESPFEERIPNGAHPIVLCVASLPDTLQLAAYSALYVGDHEPVQWDIAHVMASPIPAMPNYFNVESGTACYVDAEALPLLAAKFDPTNPADPFRLWLAQELYEHEPPCVGAMSLEVCHEPRLNTVLFETGWGNSCYRSYIGRDVTGGLCCLLTDFGVLDLSSTGARRSDP